MRSIAFVLLFATASIAAAGEALTEAESLRLGLARAELAELARGATGEAEADALEAGLWPNPTLDYTNEQIDGSPGSTEQTWLISQAFDLAGRRGLRREAGARKLVAARAGNAARHAERSGEIRRSFHEALLKQQTLHATLGWAQQFSRIERVVGRLEKAGEVSGYDRRRLARERQSAEARLATERGELARLRARLMALIGSQGEAYGELSGSLLPDAPPALDGALTQLARRPDLQVLTRSAEAADLEGRAAARGWVPELTVGIGTKRVDDGLNRASGALITVSIPLPVFDREQAREHRTAARALAARAEYRLAQAKAEGELRGLHRQIEHLIGAASSYRRQAVAPSAELLQIAETAYQGGESTILELLDAYRGALEAETTALDLEWKARSARIEFDLLTGSNAE